ncbi:MAG: hypothetical protein ACXWYE_08505, partial [Actinomycetota bacterium]
MSAYEKQNRKEALRRVEEALSASRAEAAALEELARTLTARVEELEHELATREDRVDPTVDPTTDEFRAAAIELQRSLALRVAELEARRAAGGEGSSRDAQELFDLADRVRELEAALDAALRRAEDAAAATAATEALLAEAGVRLAELSEDADRADRAE